MPATDTYDAFAVNALCAVRAAEIVWFRRRARGARRRCLFLDVGDFAVSVRHLAIVARHAAAREVVKPRSRTRLIMRRPR